MAVRLSELLKSRTFRMFFAAAKNFDPGRLLLKGKVYPKTGHEGPQEK